MFPCKLLPERPAHTEGTRWCNQLVWAGKGRFPLLQRCFCLLFLKIIGSERQALIKECLFAKLINAKITAGSTSLICSIVCMSRVLFRWRGTFFFFLILFFLFYFFFFIIKFVQVLQDFCLIVFLDGHWTGWSKPRDQSQRYVISDKADLLSRIS